MAQKQIIIICGEPSGDLHAAGLAEKILEINPGVKISGVGGALLRSAGAEIYADIKGLSVIGLFDALKKLPKFFALRRLVLKKINEEKPDAVILVDFSGFNLRLAKKIGRAAPVIYYISPQVWASRQGRIKTIKKYISKMIVLFKFEEEFYKGHGIDAVFVGHPLLDIVKPTIKKDEFLAKLNLSPSKTTIALLPGSRKAEIENILPVMLKTAALISKEIDAQFLVAKAPQADADIYNKIISGSDIELRVVDGRAYDCLEAADFSLVASGTATLETAILQKPFAIIYKMNLLNYLLYRPQVKVPYIGMVNIVAQKLVVPEFVQFQADPKKISEKALKLLGSPSEMGRIRNSLADVKSSLGDKGASARAAKIILDMIQP